MCHTLCRAPGDVARRTALPMVTNAVRKIVMRLVVVKALPSVASEEAAFEGQDVRSRPCDSGGGATWVAETLRGKPGLGEGIGTVKKQTQKRASIEVNKKK